jgi:glycosyltransferase involved in cell wall biosynthesis
MPKSQIPSALAAADACIAILKPLKEYASTYPNKVFDYMAAGRPVALAIDGVIRDVVEAAGGGLFAAPGDAAALAGALRQLSGNREAARQMGMRGRQYLEQEFSRAAIADRLVEAMRRLVP